MDRHSRDAKFVAKITAQRDALATALRNLLKETQDWEDALCGERPSLIVVRQAADEALRRILLGR